MDASNTYQRFARFYDAYIQKFTADLPFYKSFCNKTDKILEIGCGTGRVLKYLLESGYELTGVDISPEMLDIAKNKLHQYLFSLKLKLYNHIFTDLPIYDKFNKVLITFYTFNYIIDNPEKFLKNITLSMDRNAEIIIDLFYPRTLKNEQIEGIWQESTINLNGIVILVTDVTQLRNN